jgi:membrane protein DedA with SNARE-associated domain
VDALVHTLQAHAILLAVLLPPAIRLAGHWLPEEPLMMAMGIVASQAAPGHAALVLALLWASHSATDHAVFSLGNVALPRLGRWPRVQRRVVAVGERLAESRWALLSFIPARVLPLGRGAWLLAFGVAGVARSRFAAVDAVAITLHLLVWCGLGWWLGVHAGDLVAVARPAALWLLLAAVAAFAAVLVWRRLTAS